MQDVTSLIPPVPHAFGFTTEHALTRQQARRFLEENSPREHARTLHGDPLGYDRALYRRVLELGWLGLTLPESYGGAGLDELHLMLLWEELGRALMPSPLFGALLATHAISLSRHEAHRGRWLPEALSGELLPTFAFGEPKGAWGPRQVSCRAEPKDGAWQLTGVKAHVPFGMSATLAVVPAVDHRGEVGLFVLDLPSAGVEAEPELSVDSTRRSARLVLDRARVPHDRRLQGDGARIFERVCTLGYAVLAAEMVGAGEQVLELTRDYAATREQFGRAIGSFQAVKHPIVNTLCQLELARSLTLGAGAALSDSRLIDQPEVAERAARMAKAYGEQMLSYAVQKGVQLHGGFGFTWECDVQLYFKRMLWTRATLGDAAHHKAALAAALFD